MNPSLIAVAEEAANNLPFSIAVIEGLRTKERQLELFNSGRSRTLKSKHLDGRALDIAPYLPSKGFLWGDKKKFKEMVAELLAASRRLKIKIRSGSDWDMNGVIDEEELSAYTKKFGRRPLVDFPHIELV